MLFCDQAFAAYNLTSPEELSRLDIPPGRSKLPLHLNKKLDNIPVFRKAVRSVNGWVISPNEPVPFSTLLPWIRTLGQVTGFAQVTRPYSLRYAAGKVFNENGTSCELLYARCRINVVRRQRQRGHAEPNDGARQHADIFEALSLATRHGRHTGCCAGHPTPSSAHAGGLYHEPFHQSSSATATHTGTVCICDPDPSRQMHEPVHIEPLLSSALSHFPFPLPLPLPLSLPAFLLVLLYNVYKRSYPSLNMQEMTLVTVRHISKWYMLYCLDSGRSFLSRTHVQVTCTPSIEHVSIYRDCGEENTI